ncbi:MAG TPA: hypothetical protein VF071_12990 [Candidatus Limnocylindria bacterium]
MTGPTATPTGEALSPLQQDLIDLLEAVRHAERDLFAALDESSHGEPVIEGLTARDVRAHMAAWREVEARRLLGTATDDDPRPGDPVDDANARIQADRGGWTAEQAAAAAAASIDGLIGAIRASSNDALCECDQLAAGIGANGVNHALGHLSDIARIADAEERYAELAAEVEAILDRNHLMPRDSGVMLYNLACHSGLSGRTDDALRLLGTAFARRADLRDHARDDPDLESIRDAIAAI